MLKDHLILSKSMTWCELSDTIIELELEIQDLMYFVPETELDVMILVLEVYENEKEERLREEQKKSGFSRFLFEDEDINY